MLKFQIDSLDGVDEAVRGLYTEKDGKFVLGIEGLPQPEDVSGLKSKVQELLDEKKAADKARKDAEDTWISCRAFTKYRFRSHWVM